MVTFDGRLLSGIGVVSAVVEAGSFARAGDALGLTQPAVSRAVGRLVRLHSSEIEFDCQACLVLAHELRADDCRTRCRPGARTHNGDRRPR